jgi:autotransporter-associated beta strand protein
MENTAGILYNLDIRHSNALGSGDLTSKTTGESPNSAPFRGLGAAGVDLSADPGVPNDIVIDSGAVLNVGRSSNLRLEGVISGAGRLNKINTPVLILDGACTYTGGTKIQAGTLTINGSLADSTMTITGGTANGTGTLTFNIDGTTTDQIAMSAGTLTATDLNIAINATGAGLTEDEYLLVNATGGTISDTFASITGAPDYELNYDTPGQVKLVRTVVATPYQTWAGGAAFADDKNNDGVDNGIAFLLGAGDPDESARGLLPEPTEASGGLVLTFSMRNAASRGDAKLSVQWSNDLGATDPWAGNSALVPDDDATVNGVVFDITPGNPLNGVKATIPTTEASGGKLFGRLVGTEN